MIKRKELPQSPQVPSQASAAFVQSGAGDIRIGPILAIPQVLQTLGARSQTAFARAGVPLSLFRNADARMPLEAAGRLLGECARLTGCPHFGLLVGERFSLDGLGPLGELMRHAPSVGSALRSVLLHLQLHDRGAAPLLLQPEHDTALLGYSVYRHATPGTELIYDAALAIAHRILSELCGTGFVPLAVQSSYRRPARIAAYRRLPVTHIAAALQYADANAFTRAFHRWAGCSPTAWRAGERGDLLAQRP
ncbi:MAG: AraC family transcriptional regulator [Burkholderiales bacterium]|nr:AraC family transcriptional regulator [Burkholderiales bacterium]